MSDTHRISVQVDKLSRRADDESPSQDRWIEVRETTTGVFLVIDENLTVKNGDYITEDTDMAFQDWDEQVEDLDDGTSDCSQCFGKSLHLRWNDVDLKMFDRVFRAPSLERLKEALSHVVFVAFCPGDI